MFLSERKAYDSRKRRKKYTGCLSGFGKKKTIEGCWNFCMAYHRIFSVLAHFLLIGFWTPFWGSRCLGV